MQKLRVGLIGLGTVAQVVHIPVLQDMPEFEVVAGCDLSLPHAQRVAARHGIVHAYDSHEAMLRDEALDVVAVLNSDEYHAECTVAALRAGCHVLLEKPAALRRSEIDDMAKTRNAADRKVMVGYMRRHASAYTHLKSELASEQQAISHVAVRDIIGPNDFFISQTTGVLVADEVAQAAVEDRAARARRAVAESLGDASPAQSRAFRLLSGLSSHDFSALRGLVGHPRGVLAARSSGDGRFISALLDFGGYVATFETGIDRVGMFDASIEVFTGERRLRLEYDTPYIRHLPTRLTTLTSEGDELRRVESRPSFRDPYTNQWRRFHDALTGGTPFEETLEDASLDMDLAIEIASRL